MRRCIYCLGEKDEADFNREHVVQEAFDVFHSNNVVLTCVCRACNQLFGDTIDLYISRDSMEGYDRYGSGQKSPSEFKSLGKRSGARLTFAKDGPLRGALGGLTRSPDGASLEVTTAPCVGFAPYPGGGVPVVSAR